MVNIDGREAQRELYIYKNSKAIKAPKIEGKKKEKYQYAIT